MPKEFYTEKDIEDMVKRGVLSLEVNENVRADRAGLREGQPAGDEAGPRPAGQPARRPRCGRTSLEQVAAGTCDPICHRGCTAVPAAQSDLHGRIRSAVLAQLGTQVDPALLDVIIERVLKSTGVK